MEWHITVIAADGSTVLFAGHTEDRAEAEAVATEAKRRRPTAKVLFREPFGKITEWPQLVQNDSDLEA